MATEDRMSRPHVVVVANDQEWAARSLESLLGPRGYAVLRSASGRQVLGLVRSAQPDALILDTRTQDIGGLEICRALRTDPHVRPSMPIIITANDGSTRAERIEAFAAGAWDYCTQPLDGEVLLLKLATFLRAKRESDHVRDDSLIDHETGLYTLRGLARRAQEIGAFASREHLPLSCVAFSPLGVVEAGEPQLSRSVDAMVADLALVCRNRGRGSDVFGRLGPLEFGVLAPATDERGASRLLTRLQRAVDDVAGGHGAELPGARLVAGMASIDDFAESKVDAMDMLLRATDELRRIRTSSLPTSV